MYYDVFLSKEPPRDKSGAYSTVYAAVQLDSGVWHCLVTEDQFNAHHFAADTFDKLAAIHKDNDTPAHVYGSAVYAPDKVWKPTDKTPTILDAKAIK